MKTLSIATQLPSPPASPSSSSSKSSTTSGSSTSVYLAAAAKSGMLVKLHVNDGCDTAAVEIPLKNLLKVNSNKESLSSTASYSILRHCALSTLFRYAPNRQIPYYANKNFVTQFSHYEELPQVESESPVSESEMKRTIVKHIITNHMELTQALDDAASKHLLDDNDNIILHLHCEFHNQYSQHRRERVKKFRQEATSAADHVVKTLKIWVQRATEFVQHQASKVGSEDFVLVVASDGTVATGSGRTKTRVGLDEESDYDYEHVNSHEGDSHSSHNNKKEDMDWAARFVQGLLLPETIHSYKTTSTSSTPSSSCSKNHTSKSTAAGAHAKVITELQLDQYEETIDVVADSFMKGFNFVSNFFMMKLVKQSNKNNNDEVLSLSPSPSLAESASLSSDYDDDDDLIENENASVQEEGVEIVFGCDTDLVATNNGTEAISNADCEEWKIFFGGSHDDHDDINQQHNDEDGISFGSDELTLVDSPCDADDVISFSSSFAGKSLTSPTTSSSKEVEVAKDDVSDDVSWALLSDDEDNNE